MESAAAAVAAAVDDVDVVVESVVAASFHTLLAGAYCIDCTFAEVDAAAYQGGDVHRLVLVQRAFVAFLLAASLLAIVLAVAVAAVACTA